MSWILFIQVLSLSLVIPASVSVATSAAIKTYFEYKTLNERSK